MDWVKLLEGLKLWQFTLFLSVVLGMLGFTGESIVNDNSILEGKENMAIMGFFVLLAVTILLRYLPPPERRRNGTLARATYNDQIIEIAALKEKISESGKEGQE